MSFVKLDCGILDSSVWCESPEKVKVWITLLAMARANGVVEATAPGIAHRAQLPLEVVATSLEVFESPDKYSRSIAAEGRRLERVDGGYRIINYEKYRAKDHTAADRQRRRRRRLSPTRSVGVTRDTVTRHGGSRKQRQKQKQKENREGGAVPFPPSRPSVRAEESDAERRELSEKLKQEVSAFVASVLVEKPDCGLTVEKVMELASRIHADNGHAEKSFKNPDAPGIRARWLRATLSKGLREASAEISRRLFPPY